MVQSSATLQASDRAYWYRKRDPSELIPPGTVVEMFSDGVSKTTAGARCRSGNVGVVPHTPDTVGEMPPTEMRNPDRTYSSNEHCLVAYVGEVPVRVSADFVLPKAVNRADGPWPLMPSRENGGLAAIHDGSGRPLLGYVKPGSQVRKTEAGQFVTCCVNSMQHASASVSNPLGRGLVKKTARAVVAAMILGALSGWPIARASFLGVAWILSVVLWWVVWIILFVVQSIDTEVLLSNLYADWIRHGSFNILSGICAGALSIPCFMVAFKVTAYLPTIIASIVRVVAACIMGAGKLKALLYAPSQARLRLATLGEYEMCPHGDTQFGEDHMC